VAESKIAEEPKKTILDQKDKLKEARRKGQFFH